MDIKSINDYPIHNPNDESSGMDLIKNKKCDKKNLKVKWVSFKDFMDKEQNKFHNFSESHLPRKYSYNNPMGKRTIGGQSSQDLSYNQSVITTASIKEYIGKLSNDQIESLNIYAEKVGVDFKDVIKLAIKKSMDPKDLMELI